MPKIITEVQTWVRIVFFTVLKFYRLELKPNDLKKDLLLNMVTTLVMKDQTYSIIMNSILQGSADRIKTIQRNMNKYRFKVNLDKLGVSKYFQFSSNFRELIQNDRKEGYDPIGQFSRSVTMFKKSRRPSFKESTHKPFDQTIDALKEVPEINSPMSKLEYIY